MSTQEATRAFAVGDPVSCGYRYEGNFSNVTIKVISRTLLQPGNTKEVFNIPEEYSISKKFERFDSLQQQIEKSGIHTAIDTFQVRINGTLAAIGATNNTISAQFIAYSSYDDLLNRLITLFLAAIVAVITIPQGMLALKTLGENR